MFVQLMTYYRHLFDIQMAQIAYFRHSARNIHAYYGSIGS